MADSAFDPKQVARGFFAALDAQHGAGASRVIAPGFVAHLSGRPPLDGAAFAQAIDGLYTAFPDLRHHIEEIIAEGGRVAVRLTERGRQLGRFQGARPSGHLVAMRALAIVRVESGLVAELWMEVDALGRLKQLGLMPRRPIPGAE